MQKGIIVFLNGTSSSGKSSIAKKLLKQTAMKFQHVSVDDFFQGFNDFVDHKFPNLEPANEVDQNTVAQIIFDPIISMCYSTIKLFSEMGVNVIMDTVVDNEKWFKTCQELFSGHPTLFVGVICSKEELARREQARGDRAIGLANAQFDGVYTFEKYDVEVNTEELSPEACAEKILKFIRSGETYSTFEQSSKKSLGV
ncbi:chloramphenicol phosphotransferase CPT family protein [Saccharibacillus sacchari]|uniref:AAA family ATPase n=1 Tax=Saccharibacillus sacchari TaxID=456493 RepID=A0ACC6P720_9BACL